MADAVFHAMVSTDVSQLLLSDSGCSQSEHPFYHVVPLPHRRAVLQPISGPHSLLASRVTTKHKQHQRFHEMFSSVNNRGSLFVFPVSTCEIIGVRNTHKAECSLRQRIRVAFELSSSVCSPLLELNAVRVALSLQCD